MSKIERCVLAMVVVVLGACALVWTQPTLANGTHTFDATVAIPTLVQQPRSGDAVVVRPATTLATVYVTAERPSDLAKAASKLYPSIGKHCDRHELVDHYGYALNVEERRSDGGGVVVCNGGGK